MCIRDRPVSVQNLRRDGQRRQDDHNVRHCRNAESGGQDLSLIHILSMIRDLYDNSIVAYKTARRQTVNLVLDTIRLAMKKEKVAAELQLHRDQGLSLIHI